MMRISFTPGVLWELREYLFGGFVAELEYGWNFEELADSIRISHGKYDIELLESNALGLRSGLGLNLIWQLC